MVTAIEWGLITALTGVALVAGASAIDDFGILDSDLVVGLI